MQSIRECVSAGWRDHSGSATCQPDTENQDRRVCNGTRMIYRARVTSSMLRSSAARTLADEYLFQQLNRLTPSDSGLPFTSRRRQFPVRLCYCMTVNKAQSQTLDYVGLYLRRPVFTHSQLYVGLSRAGSANRIKSVYAANGRTLLTAF